MYQNTIPGHYIVGNGSYSIPLKSPKVTGCNFESETEIFKIFNFWSKKWPKMSTFLTKNLKISVSDSILHPGTFGDFGVML